MGILGIYASSVLKVTNSYESIASYAPTSGTSVTFSSIPSSYKHLQLRIISFGDTAVEVLQFNGDTASNYNRHRLYGNGSTVTASSVATSSIQLNGASSTGSTTIGAAMIVDILDYTNTNKNKTVRILEGVDLNGSGEVGLFSGLWRNNTDAVTSIKIETASTNYTTGTKISLYGIKG